LHLALRLNKRPFGPWIEIIAIDRRHPQDRYTRLMLTLERADPDAAFFALLLTPQSGILIPSKFTGARGIWKISSGPLRLCANDDGWWNRRFRAIRML